MSKEWITSGKSTAGGEVEVGWRWGGSGGGEVQVGCRRRWRDAGWRWRWGSAGGEVVQVGWRWPLKFIVSLAESLCAVARDPPSNIAPMISAEMDSKRSAPVQ